MSTSSKNMRQEFADTMLEVGTRDEELVVVVGDISHGILQSFAKACPERYFNIGILEPTMMSLGAGMAKVGLKPVLHTIAPFIIERSFEQIKLDFCYHQLGGNIISVGSAFDYSNLGCTHHCYSDFALLKTLPNTEVLYPASALEFNALFKQTYRNDKVTYFRLPGRMHSLKFNKDDISLGKGILVEKGDDLSVVATGPHLDTAMEIRQKLAAEGKSAEIIYIHTVRPLDEELIVQSVAKTGNVIVIEEHMRSGGLGDDVLRAISALPETRFYSASIPDRFVTGYGTYDELLESVGLTCDQIIEKLSW